MKENDAQSKQLESISEKLDKSSSISKSKPAAFTLVIQSWATPIVGILMLIAGLLGGYFGRPLITPQPTAVAVGEIPPAETAAESVVIPTPDADRAARQQELMALLLETTRHFRGDPNAPVTLIEFSDFQ